MICPGLHALDRAACELVNGARELRSWWLARAQWGRRGYR